MTYLVSDVMGRVKRTFGDESGVQLEDTDLYRWINDAQVEICRKNEWLQATATTPIVAGTWQYNLPTDLLLLRSVYLSSGQQLDWYSKNDYDIYVRTYDPTGTETLSGSNARIYTVWGGKISLYPHPLANDTLTIDYVQRPPTVTVLTEALALPDQYFNRVVEYVLQQAYEMDENFEASSMKGQQFHQGLEALSNEQHWASRAMFPQITIMPDDL